MTTLQAWQEIIPAYNQTSLGRSLRTVYANPSNWLNILLWAVAIVAFVIGVYFLLRINYVLYFVSLFACVIALLAANLLHNKSVECQYQKHLKGHEELHKRYRSFYQFIRFRLFQSILLGKGLTCQDFAAARTFLEAEETWPLARPNGFALFLVGLTAGIVGGAASTDEFWKNPYIWASVLGAILILWEIEYLGGDLLRRSRHNELRRFLCWLEADQSSQQQA